MSLAKKAAEKLGVTERAEFLRLGIKQEKGGVKSTGPHRVKFISEKSAKIKDWQTQQEKQVIQYVVEERGIQKIWNVPLYNKKGEPNYLLGSLAGIKMGEEAILEMKGSSKNGVFISFIDVRCVGKVGNDVEIVEEDEPGETNSSGDGEGEGVPEDVDL